MPFTFHILPIASLGVLDFNLPLLKNFGSLPRVLIINNLHGDELTGYYILQKLLSEFVDFKNQITIIPSANPLGLIQRTRFVPLDYVDLNRDYPNPPQAQGATSVLREKLIQLAAEHDVIIDLHTFMRPCFSAGLLLPQANEKNNDLVKRCLSVAAVDIIIKMNVDNAEKRVESSLGIYLIKQYGKVVISLEYPPIRQIKNDAELNNLADGLHNIFRIIAGDNISPAAVKPVFERQKIMSPATGLFIQSKSLGDKITAGDLIGTLINPKDLKLTSVSSPFTGVVTEIADRQLYIFGEKLVTIGKPS